MSRILGIDPGATTGWVVYDAKERIVLKAGQFAGHDMPLNLQVLGDIVAIERIEAHGASFPQVVEAAYTCGRIVGRIEGATVDVVEVDELRRHEIRKALQEATHGAIRVKDDASVWAALKLLHGGEEQRPEAPEAQGRGCRPRRPDRRCKVTRTRGAGCSGRLPSEDSGMMSTMEYHTIDIVASEFGVAMSDLLGKSRARHHSEPRQVAMWLLYNCARMSYESVAKAFGRADHTTARYAAKMVEDRAMREPSFARLLGDLRARVTERRAEEMAE